MAGDSVTITKDAWKPVELRYEVRVDLPDGPLAFQLTHLAAGADYSEQFIVAPLRYQQTWDVEVRVNADGSFQLDQNVVAALRNGRDDE